MTVQGRADFRQDKQTFKIAIKFWRTFYTAETYKTKKIKKMLFKEKKFTPQKIINLCFVILSFRKLVIFLKFCSYKLICSLQIFFFTFRWFAMLHLFLKISAIFSLHDENKIFTSNYLFKDSQIIRKIFSV